MPPTWSRTICTVAVESIRNFLAAFMIAYEAWVARMAPPRG